MANSSKHLMHKAIKVARKVALAGLVCVTVSSAGPAFAGNTTYQYDSLGRVIKVTYPDSKQICYAYDAAGNRTQVKRQATGTCTVTGSTVTSSLTAQTMFAAQQNSYLQAGGAATETTDTQVMTDGETSSSLTSDESVSGN